MLSAFIFTPMYLNFEQYMLWLLYNVMHKVDGLINLFSFYIFISFKMF